MKFLLILSLSINALASPEDDLRQGNVQFSTRLSKEINRIKPNENVVFSPFSIQVLLAALVAASRNSASDAAQQIRTNAGLPATDSDIQKAFEAIFPKLNKSDDDFKLFQASKFYFAHYYDVKDWYRKITEEVYRTEIEKVDFNNAGQVTDNINSWVSKKSGSQISDFVPAGDIARNTRNVLINVFYLMGKWSKPFHELNNVWIKFHGPNSNREISMMFMEATFGYAEDNHAKYLKMEMVREGGNAAMELILPHEGRSLAQVIDKLKSPKYATPRVSVTIPKFIIDTDVKLKPVLKTLGIQSLFDFNGLDAPGLEYPGHPFVMVTDVFQRSFVNVSERGVVATSGTGGTILVDSPTDHKEFKADRPFLFRIVVDDIVLYAGQVVDP